MQQPEKNAQFIPVSDEGKSIFLFNQPYVYTQWQFSEYGFPESAVLVSVTAKVEGAYSYTAAYTVDPEGFSAHYKVTITFELSPSSASLFIPDQFTEITDSFLVKIPAVTDNTIVIIDTILAISKEKKRRTVSLASSTGVINVIPAP